MKKLISIAVAVVVLVAILSVNMALGSDSQPAAKATAQIAELNVVAASATSAETVDWDSDIACDTILTQEIKTSNMKDLLIDVSLQSGLYTETNVKSSGGVKDTSGAAAAAVVAVFVDDQMVFPGYPVVFEGRVQVLSARLQGILNPDFTISEPEEIGLIIGTLSANSFTFMAPDLTSGVHTVEVKAAAVSAAYSQQGSAAARAAIGLGSVTVQAVRMIKGENVIIEITD